MLPYFINCCHPECHYECDDPVCYAICEPTCQPVLCEACYNTSNNIICSSTAGCYITCPIDQCESDSCPQCETQCNPLICNNNPICFIQCQETMCSWSCRVPTLHECPAPVCQLQCEMPACEYQNGIKTNMSFILLFFIMIFNCI